MPRLAAAGLATALVLLAPGVAAGKPRDRNHNRIPDRWEKRHGVATKRDRSARDADRDGLTVRAEWRSATDPRRPDSDRDGRPDGSEDRDRDGLANAFEVTARTHPGRRDSDGDRRRDGREDPDLDQLDNAAEARFGYAPRRRDSDGDGVRDGGENPGVIRTVAGDALTIRLARGGTLRGRIVPGAEIGCEMRPAVDGSGLTEFDPETPGEDEDVLEEDPLDGEDSDDLDPGDDPVDEVVPEDDFPEGPFPDETIPEDELVPDERGARVTQAPGEEIVEELPGEEALPDPCAGAVVPGALVHAAELRPSPAGPALIALELLAR